MQTNFSLAQLADPDIAEANKILRACVHCGFCTATCPTYVLLGDELDSPRGRIYLIKDMLENDRPASPEVVTHIDRCLSCLACMTTCPSGVHYMHLVDHARAHIEEIYTRPIADRLLRIMLAKLMVRPRLFRAAMLLGLFAKPLIPTLRGFGLARLAAMLRLVPGRLPAVPPRLGRVIAAEGERKGRVALLTGCVAPVLSPQINEAAVRVLTRHGLEVVLVAGEGCCGSMAHHMGREHEALAQVRANVDAWTAEIERGGLDAIIITASGCGTTVKDYGFMLREDSAYADKAARISSLARDVSEYLATLPFAPQAAASRPALTVAYHAACSLQHGQKIVQAPKLILSKSGFVIEDIAEGHLCCGSAGTYNILQPELATRLRDRKVRNIERTRAHVIAAGNIGCITQLATGTNIPIVHPVELVDWATGGPLPPALRKAMPAGA
ncbi:MAG TPA: glycolate oxidase subunit GlcF [Xanthobacteraceae bacterium]|nr:glycolate oxidase subunit GlcF [Xanthobacteraceae bacterium]